MSFLKKKVSKADQDRIDEAGLVILKDFANNMKHGVEPKDKMNLVLVQKHFNWTKTFLGNSKLTYVQMVKGYENNPSSLKALNSIEDGLPDYVKRAAMFHISEVM
jgi:hypothetical protein